MHEGLIFLANEKFKALLPKETLLVTTIFLIFIFAIEMDLLYW